MKIILTLFLLLAKTIAVGQKGILYNDLRIDIFDEKISLLNIKEIEQSRNYTVTHKLASGKDTVNSYSNIQFVLKYDSLNRIHSVFYDFEKEFSSYNDRILNAPNLGLNPKPMNIILTNTKLYPSYNNNDTIYYNYYENNYIYNNQNNQLEYIKFSFPFRYINDGVFIQEKKYNDICYKYTGKLPLISYIQK